MNIPPDARLRYYGLTEAQYVELWEACDGRCPICERKFLKSRPACVDHDHKTFLVRGLLCGNCNYLLGVLHDDAEWLYRAAGYLKHPPAGFLGEIRIQDAPPRQGE